MQRIFFSIFVLFIQLATGAQTIDVQHYKFSIALNDNNDSVYGKAEITVKFLQPVSDIEFDLKQAGSPGEGGKGMFPDRIAGRYVRGFARNLPGDKIKIFHSQPAKTGDTATYSIFYRGMPENGLIISKNKYGDRTFFSDNWPDRAHHWLPCIDDPADKASVEFIVTAPAHYQVISNGILLEESNLPGTRKLTHWKEDVPLPTKVMVIGVADFAVQYAGEVNEIPVSSWIFPQDRDKGFYDYSPAMEILAFYMNYIGPYPYKKLANVQSKTMFGGMENASAIFYSENSVNGRREQESLLAHEIVHQWFGNMATEKSFAHLWLSEGFATYLSLVYLESKYGTDSMSYELKKDRLQVIGFAGEGRPVVDHNSSYMDLLNANSYQKGGWVLHMLRRQLGDSVFRQSIRTYYNTYKGKNAGTEDLESVFEKISKKNLDVFFRQWLYHPGLPEIKITWKYLTVQKKLQVTVEQMQSTIFQLPLEIEISTPGSRSYTEKLSITKRSQTFSLATKSKPLKIVADPKTSLLFESVVTEIK